MLAVEGSSCHPPEAVQVQSFHTSSPTGLNVHQHFPKVPGALGSALLVCRRGPALQLCYNSEAKGAWILLGPHFISQMNSFAVGMKGYWPMRASAEQPPGRLHIGGISCLFSTFLLCLLFQRNSYDLPSPFLQNKPLEIQQSVMPCSTCCVAWGRMAVANATQARAALHSFAAEIDVSSENAALGKYA